MKLTKAMLPKENGRLKGYRLSASWFTNGCWAVRRELLQPPQALWDRSAWQTYCGSEVDEMEDALLDSELVPKHESDLRVWRVTRLCYLDPSPRDVVVYTDGSHGTGHLLGLDRRYFDMFGRPAELISEGPDRITRIRQGEHLLAVVMPVDLKADSLKTLFRIAQPR